MASFISNKIKVTLTWAYSIHKSAPNSFSFMFDYHICIENGSKNGVKLLRRHWSMFDSCGEFREEEGLGVQNEQPVIRPGGKHEYDSTAEFYSELGRMHGWYQMQNIVTNKLCCRRLLKIINCSNFVDN